MSIPSDIERKLTDAVFSVLDSLSLSGKRRERYFAEFNDWLIQLQPDNRFERWLSEDYFGPYEPERLSSEANERARALLEKCLSASQRKELERKGYFHVRVGKRLFRILRKGAHNVLEIKNGRAVRTFCAIPKVDVPIHDTMLAQKLTLECNPKAFFSVANVSPRSGRKDKVISAFVAAITPILKDARVRFEEERHIDFRRRLDEALRAGMEAYQRTKCATPHDEGNRANSSS